MRKKSERSFSYLLLLYFLIFSVVMGSMMAYYYISSKNMLYKNISSNLERDAGYIQKEMDSTIQTMVNSTKTIAYTTASQLVLFSNVPSDKINHFSTAKELIANAKDTSDYIVDLFFYSDSGHLYTESEYYKHFHESMDYYGYDRDVSSCEEFLSDRIYSESNSHFFLYYLPIISTSSSVVNSTRTKGLCAIMCNFSTLLPQCEGFLNDSYSYYVLYNDTIISTSNPINELSFKDFSVPCNEFDSVKVAENEYITYSIEDGNWQIICLADKDLLSIHNIEIGSYFYNIALLITLFLAAILFLTGRRLSGTVNNMLKELEHLQNSTDGKRLTIPSFSELKNIALQINRMIDRLSVSAQREKQITQQLYAANFAQKEAEMIAYRSQINPHFFFNTLECIRSMAQYYSVNSIEETVTAMSKLFQYSLYSTSTVTFAQELDMLEQYFLITSMRFPDRYQLKKQIAEDTLHFPVPSMIVQPLVENSINHAFKKSKKRTKNIVFIQAEINEQNQLIISITDNGCGMTEKELSRLNIWKRLPEEETSGAKDSIGIQNIFKRIKLFSEHNHIYFYSKSGHYTKVVLTLCPTETTGLTDSNN